MFAIHSPQTVELKTDDEAAEPAARINFSYAGADTSRCKMEIMSKDRIWTIIFNQRGYVVDQSFTAGPEDTDPEAPVLSDADYIVNGVDTRSFNPYTHRAPVDADTAYRDGQFPGFKQPSGDSKEAREARKQAIGEAHGNARKAIDEQRARMDETPEARVERERKERDEKLEQVAKQLQKDQASLNQPAQQVGEPARNPDGSVVNVAQEKPDARDQPTGPGYDPLVPAASSPMPNSAPPHRQNEPNPGVVNTSQSVGGPATYETPRRPNPDRV
jgi:hypothetical protein